MVIGTPLAPMIIFYDNYDSTQESYTVAMQLRTNLRQQQVNCAAVPYKDALDLSTPQYLILVYSAQTQRPPQVDAVIDKMLDRVVQRQMKSVIAVTTAASTSSSLPVSLPEKWASIPTYNANASDYADRARLIEDIWREVHSVKVPYSQAESRAPGQRPGIARRLQTHPFLWPAVIVIACLLAIGGTGLLLLSPLAPSTSSAAKQTALASRSTPSSGTATAATPQAIGTPDPNRQKELTSATHGTPTVSGFQKGDAWSTLVTDTTSCAYANTNYSVFISQSGQYMPCLVSGLAYKNFALQVSMDIKGDAGGIIFRSSGNTYYRLAVNQIYTPSTDKPAFALVLCSKGECSTNSTNVGAPVRSVTATVDKKPIVLTVIVRDNNIDVYANSKFVTRFTDSNDTAAGQVGVYAADLNNKTTVTFSALKIWSLDGK